MRGKYSGFVVRPLMESDNTVISSKQKWRQREADLKRREDKKNGGK